MTVQYDGEIDILDIRLKDGKYAYSENVNGNTIIDLDVDGRILAIEILNVSDFLDKKLLEKILKAEAPE